MTIDDIKNRIKVIGEKYNLESIFLFGSRARRTNTSDSDYDLHVFAKKPISLIKHSNILADCKEILEGDVDLIINNSYDDDFMRNIKNEEILIYEG